MKEQPQFNKDSNVTKKIMPVTDSGYLENQKEKRDDHFNNRRFFEEGLIALDEKINTLSSITLPDRIIKPVKDQRANEIIKIKDYLFKKIFVTDTSIETLMIKYKYLRVLNLPSNLHEKFNEMINKNPSESTISPNKKLIKQLFKNDFFYNCAEYITKNPEKLDDQLLIEIVYERKKQFDKIDQSLQENKDRFQKDFLSNLEKFKLKYKLNFDINAISKKLLETELGCVDPLVAELEGIGGFYDINTHKIAIGTGYEKEKINHIYNHEALHATSGITVLKETSPSNEEYDGVYNMNHYSLLRSGLSFQSPSGIKNKVSLNWLNEAITEDITEEIDHKEIHSYENERSILSFLIKNSNHQITKTDFYNAYFEDYDSGTEEKIPNWKNLFNKIQNIYGATFLQRLDGLIKKNGIKK